jgi:hypothetical protein
MMETLAPRTSDGTAGRRHLFSELPSYSGLTGAPMPRLSAPWTTPSLPRS